MIIRMEESRDRTAVFTVNSAAFERVGEAELVDRVRAEAEPILSLVAEDGEHIVGHILFSPVTITGDSDCKVMGLGPVAVLPERQREGVGSLLIRRGLEACRDLGFGAVVVLGHPEYYPRFGFRPASRFGITSEYDVPDEVFMALELMPGYLKGVNGKVLYHSAFRDV